MNAYRAMAARPAGSGFLPWETLGGYEGFYPDRPGDPLDVAYTTPENAVRTANWVRKHGIKPASRRISGDEQFGMDVAPFYQGDVLPFVRMLKRLARQARKTPQQDYIAFPTELGGYPFPSVGQLWEGPR